MSLESAFQYLIAPGIVAAIVIAAQYFILPKMEREKARETQLFQHKREMCLEAIQLMDRHINAQKLESLGEKFRGHTPQAHVPTEDVNRVLSQLMLSASDENVPKDFVTFFGTWISGDILVKRGQFILSLRKEVYGKSASTPADRIPFYYDRSGNGG